MLCNRWGRGGAFKKKTSSRLTHTHENNRFTLDIIWREHKSVKGRKRFFFNTISLIPPLTHFEDEEEGELNFLWFSLKPKIRIWPSDTCKGKKKKEQRLVPVTAAYLLDVTDASSRNMCLSSGAQINSEVKRGESRWDVTINGPREGQFPLGRPAPRSPLSDRRVYSAGEHEPQK